MKTSIITMALIFAAIFSTKAQNLHITSNTSCDGRELVAHLFNPGCGSYIGATNALVIWSGDDYTVNLASIWPGGTLPPNYEIYAVEVRAVSSCLLTPTAAANACGYEDGVTVGEPSCTGLNTSECYELSNNCGPSGGGVGCSAGHTTNVNYNRNAGTGDVLVEVF